MMDIDNLNTDIDLVESYVLNKIHINCLIWLN